MRGNPANARWFILCTSALAHRRVSIHFVQRKNQINTVD